MDEISRTAQEPSKVYIHMRSYSTLSSMRPDQNPLIAGGKNADRDQTQLKQKVRILVTLLKRDRIKTERKSVEYKFLSALMDICRDLLNLNTVDAQRKVQKLKQKPIEDLGIKRHLDALDLIVSNLNIFPEPLETNHTPSIKIDTSAINSIKQTMNKKSYHRRQSSHFSIENHKQEFYSLCLTIKITLDPRHPANKCCIEDIYSLAMDKQIPKMQWSTFIQEYFHKMSIPL